MNWVPLILCWYDSDQIFRFITRLLTEIKIFKSFIHKPTNYGYILQIIIMKLTLKVKQNPV